MPASHRFSRRIFLKRTAYVALAGGSAAVISSLVPSASALDILTVPKLRYDPTVDQLKSDWDLQKQMLALDMQVNVGTPLLGKGLIAFDSRNFDVIGDLTSRTQKPDSADLSIGVDGYPPQATHTIDADDFGINYTWNRFASPTKKAEFFRAGNNKWGDPSPLPEGSAWDVYFDKSYWNQEKDHIYFIAQIPNSVMGPGNMNQYGFVILMSVNDSHIWANWPANGVGSIPETYGQIRTEQSIPEIPNLLVLPTTIASLIMAGFAMRKGRMDKLRKASIRSKD